jgi:peptidoglycan hydrolase-like protein with peptidoglycan-binding domain
MNLTDAQTALSAAKFYAGKIDGLDGPMTQAAVIAALRSAIGTAGDGWPPERRLIGAVQAALNALEHEAGAVDGWAGHNTANALEAFLYQRSMGKPLRVARMSDAPAAKVLGRDLPRQAECDRFYGTPGDEVKSRLVTVDLPYDLRLDWALDQTVGRVTLHSLCAPSFVLAMEAVRAEYGADQQAALGLDRYAGGYMHRRMRGGSKWSMHAYGCAVDFYAAPNGLTTRCPRALFCGPDYRAFLDIMQDHGWLPALRLWGADAMHFQRARL